MNHKFLLIKKIYLYLLALIGIVLIIIGGFRLTDLGLKTFVFRQAEEFYAYPAPARVEIFEGEEKVAYQEPPQEEVAEYQRKTIASRRQDQASGSLALLIIGLPIYLYHWQIIKNSEKSEKYD